MMALLYRWVTFLAGPLIDLYLVKRRLDGKEDKERFRERLGYGAFPRPKGILIWVHAASVGESLSVLPIINKITHHSEAIRVLLTTGTVTSAKMIESRLGDRVFHQYVPTDKIIAVKRFISHWKPNLAIWVESEFWPNLIFETKKQCPLILLNGRISEGSFHTWKRYQSIGIAMLRSFSMVLPQSQQDADRLIALGAENIHYVGNLKFDAPLLPSDPKEMGQLLSMIGDRRVWLAASTHPGEEEYIAEVHLALKEEMPDMLTIIVPRHADRGEDISQMLKAKELTYRIRSKQETLEEDTDIYIVDTMGELGLFYRLVSIVFIGGSLVPHGGQNPLEAARLESVIITGPNMQNFASIVSDMLHKEAMIQVQDKDELAKVVLELFYDLERQEKLSEAASKVIEDKAGVLDSVMELLVPYIDDATQESHAQAA